MHNIYDFDFNHFFIINKLKFIWLYQTFKN